MSAFLALAAGVAAAPSAPASPTPAASASHAPALLDPASDPLFRRMVALNASLATYRAHVHLDVALHSFPFISSAFDGSVYYKRPDKYAVDFDTVPALAAEFKKVYPHLDPPSLWPTLYDMATLSDQAGTSTLRLVPKKNGRVDHLDVEVDDATATIRRYTWTYKDGGDIGFTQTFSDQGGKFLPATQLGTVDLPAYKASLVAHFSAYRLNVALADSLFAQ
ncbi:MAG: hypothetical protein ACREM2_10760 [Vulcanimicrobiaceae bacterium]